MVFEPNFKDEQKSSKQWEMGKIFQISISKKTQTIRVIFKKLLAAKSGRIMVFQYEKREK